MNSIHCTCGELVVFTDIECECGNVIKWTDVEEAVIRKFLEKKETHRKELVDKKHWNHWNHWLESLELDVIRTLKREIGGGE